MGMAESSAVLRLASRGGTLSERHGALLLLAKSELSVPGHLGAAHHCPCVSRGDVHPLILGQWRKFPGWVEALGNPGPSAEQRLPALHASQSHWFPLSVGGLAGFRSLPTLSVYLSLFPLKPQHAEPSPVPAELLRGPGGGSELAESAHCQKSISFSEPVKFLGHILRFRSEHQIPQADVTTL